MDEPLEEGWLDARLREESRYIDDAGFTAQVIQKLPVRAARRSFRGAILLSVTLLASLVTYLVSDGGRFIVAAFEQVSSMPLLYICVIAIVCSVVISVMAASAALSKVREEG